MAMLLNSCLQSRAVLRQLPSKILSNTNCSVRCLTIKSKSVEEWDSKDSYFDRNEKLNRPLSPHLSIYQKQLTSVLSISHRFTGLALTGYITTLGIGALVLPHDFSYYVTAIEGLQLGAPTLILTKFLLAFPVTYHTTNGIRHLVWDFAKFLTLKDVYTTGYAMLLTSVILAGALAIA